jgi:hypothetical protein
MKAPGGVKRYSFTLSLTSALDGDGWLRPCPGRFTPGKETRYPLYRRLGGHQGRSARMGKISPPPGFHPRKSRPCRVAIPTELSRPSRKYGARTQTCTRETISPKIIRNLAKNVHQPCPRMKSDLRDAK